MIGIKNGGAREYELFLFLLGSVAKKVCEQL